MKWFRFRLRTTFAVTLIAAVLFSYLIYRKRRDHQRLQRIRGGFVSWARGTDRSNGKIHTFFQLNRNIDPESISTVQDKRAFLVSNTVMILRPNRSRAIIFSPAKNPPDPNRFYLLPAKKWVTTPEAVLDEWEVWRNKTF